jgi:hypothetical protein
MPLLNEEAPALPRDAQSILELAARSMFELFASASEGMLLVDRDARVVWINDQYRRFLPALGFSSARRTLSATRCRRGGAEHPDAPGAGNRQADADRPADQPRRHLCGQPHSLARRGRRGDRRAGHRAVRPPRDHAAAADRQVLAVAARPGRCAARAGHQQRRRCSRRRPAPRQIHLCQLRRHERGGGRGQAPGAPCRAVEQPGAAAGRDRHRQGAAGPRHPRRVAARGGPFVSVNIAAVPDTLLEAEFFGVAPGAYTGADRKGRDGKFKLADGGTLFLDEIGDMPLACRPSCCARLQEGEIEPLGSNKLVPFDVRIIAATSRDLPALVREGQVSRGPVLPPARAADPRAAAARAARATSRR